MNNKLRYPIIFLLATALSALLCFTIFSNHFKITEPTTNIKIENTATKNKNSYGTDIRIERIVVNEKEIPFSELRFDEAWVYLDNLLVAINPNAPVFIEYKAENVETLEIGLQKHNGSGIVNIYANDHKIGGADLYSPTWEVTTFNENLGKISLVSNLPLFLLFWLLTAIILCYSPRLLFELKHNEIYSKYLKYMLLPLIVLILGSVYYEKIVFGSIGAVFILLFGIFTLIIISDVKNKRALACGDILILLLTAVICFYMVELINTNIENLSVVYTIGNTGIYFAVLLFLYLLTRRVSFAASTGAILTFIYGTANYYVTLFRGTPIVAGDFFTIATAGNVLKNYHYVISWDIFYAAILLVCWCVIVSFLMTKLPQYKRRFTLTSILVLALIGCIAKMDFYKPQLDLWDLNSNIKKYGIAMSLVSNIKNMRVEEPADYSYDAIKELKSQYVSEKIDGYVRPNVIAVMNESYSDLSVLSDSLDSELYMPFYNSLTENTVKGTALASTIGGGTGNSEYEFLTGNSMAFIPGTVPYQQFIVKDTFSLASIFKEMGYATIAIHPYDKSGYNRPRVYPNLGFDDFLDITTFENPELSRDRFITDKESYKKVIEVFEENQRNGQNSFIFNVTIQNHSDYTTGFYGDNRIKISGLENEFPEVEEYLTLIKESDDALKMLIDYFGSVQSPTVLVMFGDHQPSLDNGFYERMFGKEMEELGLEESQKRYEVPFLIWANYDIQEMDEVSIGLNYLSSVLFETAGMATTPYQNFLLELMKSVPQMNTAGYYTQEEWLPHTEEPGKNPLLVDYWKIQYSNMFEGQGNKEWFLLDDDK